MRAVVGQRGERVVGTCGSDGEVGHQYLGILGSPQRVEARGGFVGLFHPRSDGELEADADTRVVGCGEELRADKLHEEYGAYEDGEADHDRDGAVRYDAAQHAGIPCVEAVKRAFDVYVPVLLGILLGLGLGTQTQPLAAQHRGERKGAGSGYDHHDGHHPSELAEQHAGHARHKREREEHGDERKGRRHYAYGHLIGAVHGCLFRIGTTFDMGSHIFKHHNGVVHHHAYRNGQSR